jgi:hypothetical protein
MLKYEYKTRYRERTAAIREELLAEVFHPLRIEKLIEACGIDFLDNL